jgi:hypothetical protein
VLIDVHGIPERFCDFIPQPNLGVHVFIYTSVRTFFYLYRPLITMGLVGLAKPVLWHSSRHSHVDSTKLNPHEVYLITSRFRNVSDYAAAADSTLT